MNASSRAAAGAVALTLALLVQGCRAAPAAESGQANVTCAENPADGVIDCEIEHVTGASGVNACWTVLCRCKNGREARSARLCQSVQRGATVRKSIPLSELANGQDCDRVLGSDVHELSVSAL